MTTARVSLSDWSSSDVRRCLHGGCCLATRLPDHCQLPSVPQTQALALWITLHEHAQRREFGFWMRGARPSSCLPPALHPSIHPFHSLLPRSHFLGCRSRNNRVTRSDVMNEQHACDNYINSSSSPETGIDSMCCMLEVSQNSGLSGGDWRGVRWELQLFIWTFNAVRTRRLRNLVVGLKYTCRYLKM